MFGQISWKKKKKSIYLLFFRIFQKRHSFFHSHLFPYFKRCNFFYSHSFSFASTQDHWPRLLHFHATFSTNSFGLFSSWSVNTKELSIFFWLGLYLVYTVYVHKTPSFKKRSIYEVNLPFSCLINLCSYFNFRVESVSWSRNYEMIASGHSPLNYVINTWWIYPGINH